ncbi:MAG: tetratricopeptide repeat protein [Candidatus Competibacter sp.]|nr:tetratricopeptide repeat protein [Candidatus Competibacter sp.]MDG4607093.1 tetratricopeptide repeat protein [Candidatus Contendobacter sp.]HRD48086.1 tetratricopeptide repeat protein [Candidatus Contendobacter sp.]
MTDQTTLESSTEHAPGEVSIAEALDTAIRAHQAGVLEMAETIYQRILQVDPAHSDAMQFLGMLRYQRGDADEALRLLDRVVELCPDHAGAHNNRGNILKALGRRADALAAYQNAVRLDANNVEAYCNVGALLATEGRLQEAINLYYEAIKRNPAHADTFYHLGQALAWLGRDDDAVQAYYRAITANTRHGAAYRALAETLYRLKRTAEGVSAFSFALYCLGQNERGQAALREWLRLDPDNPQARHTWQAWTGEAVPDRAPDDYVRSEFDRFADEFDSHLRTLEYHAPELVITALAAHLTPTAALRILDAGCGTGLCGPLLRPYAAHLAGVDLSPRMLEKARERGGYDALEVAELTAYIAAHPGEYDVIVSADTLVYFGDLEPPARAAASALRLNGLLAFTVERLADAAGEFRLNPNGRYAHSQTYVEHTLRAAGLTPVAIESVVLRLERAEPVHGYVALARKLSDPALAS